MITVIIPALNEEKTIRQVVHLANNSAHVSEVIVVDDKSMDNTVAEARKEGATVITSTKLGKGSSMRDGILKMMLRLKPDSIQKMKLLFFLMLILLRIPKTWLSF